MEIPGSRIKQLITAYMEILLLFGKEEVPSRKPCWETARDIKKSRAFLMAPSAHPRQKFCDCAGCMMTGNWESNTAVGVIKSPSRKHTHTQVHTLSPHLTRSVSEPGAS